MSGPIPSPCRQICVLGHDNHCDGCGRSLDEVRRWLTMTPTERLIVMARVADWAPRPSQS